MSDDLTAWLRGVLDEDEADTRYWLKVHHERDYHSSVLADIAAKRAILDLHEAQDDPDAVRQGVKPYCQTCSEPLPWEHPDVVRNDLHPEPFDYPCPTLRLLASAYAHRPGYREQWRP